MKRAVLAAAAVAFILSAIVLAGCASTPPANVPANDTSGTPGAGGAAGGTRIAPGLYDMPDGTVQAVGTLEWRDLEGGFWAVIGGTESTGDAGKVVAVLANAKKDDPKFADLAGQPVMAVGKRLSGASVRMAGPEIDVTSITAFTDAGPAQ